VAPLPAGAAPLAGFSPRALFISARTPHPKACWSWISFLSAQPDATSLLPTRRDIAASDAWRSRVGVEVADAWLVILDREGGAEDGPAYSQDGFALYWFDDALADVLAGGRGDEALAEAQAKAMAYVDCMASRSFSDESWRACAQQADPDVALPGE